MKERRSVRILKDQCLGGGFAIDLSLIIQYSETALLIPPFCLGKIRHVSKQKWDP